MYQAEKNLRVPLHAPGQHSRDHTGYIPSLCGDLMQPVRGDRYDPCSAGQEHGEGPWGSTTHLLGLRLVSDTVIAFYRDAVYWAVRDNYNFLDINEVKIS